MTENDALQEMIEADRLLTLSADPMVQIDGEGDAMIARAAVRATLANAAQLGRIADWMESLAILNPEDEAPPAAGDTCAWCPLPAHGTALTDRGPIVPSCGLHGSQYRSTYDTHPRSAS